MARTAAMWCSSWINNSSRVVLMIMATVAVTIFLATSVLAQQQPAPGGLDPGVKADPEVVACLAKGHEALNKMDIEGAVNQFRTCAEKHKDSALARYWMGVAYFSARKKEEAIAELKEAVRLEPKNLPAMAMLARAYSFDEKTLSLSEELLTRVLNVCPNFDDARFDLARIYAQRGEIDKALPLFFLLFEGEARYAVYHTEMGKIFLAGGREKEARQEFERALMIAPGFEPAKKNLEALDKKPGSTGIAPSPSIEIPGATPKKP